jgi:hypothetical protein
MSVLPLHRRRPNRALFALLGLCALGGCASVGDTISPAFVDPARYELWDCKQLEPERRNIGLRLADLERLMAKAETGTGGVVVAELAYRNEYIATRGQQKLMEETWRKNRCRESEAATPPAPPAPPPANPATPSRPVPGPKATGAVH